jgi:TolB protein
MKQFRGLPAASSAVRCAMLGAATALLVALAFPHAAFAAFPGKNGRIVFESRYLGGRIFTIRPNGEGKRRIASRDSSEPAFSANGRWIVFGRIRGENTDLFKMRADGSHKVRLTHSPANEAEPSFSPNGRKIVFARRRANGSYDLWTMRAGGGRKRRLTSTREASEGSPQYAPNGRRIAFRSGTLDLAIMKADGSRAHRITTTRNAYEWEFDFSPDGRRIVFSRSRDRLDRTDIFSVSADGSHLRRLTRSNAVETFPAFSPRSNRIAFSSDRRRADGSYRIYTMRVDGSRIRRLSGGHRGADESPSWGVAR